MRRGSGLATVRPDRGGVVDGDAPRREVGIVGADGVVARVEALGRGRIESVEGSAGVREGALDDWAHVSNFREEKGAIVSYQS